MADGAAVRELPGHEKHIYSVVFHPNGTTLFTGDLKGAIKQWDVATGQLLRTFDAKRSTRTTDGQGVDFGGVAGWRFLLTGSGWLPAGCTRPRIRSELCTSRLSACSIWRPTSPSGPAADRRGSHAGHHLGPALAQ